MATPVSVLSNRKKNSVIRLNRNSKIFKTIIKAIQEKKGENIVSLDLRKIHEAVADFFIVCQASSTTQVKAISDFVQHEVLKHCGENPYKHEGYQQSHWILIDYVNIVIHVMQPDARKFYKLEEMWNDAEATGHNE
ncbi:MAG: ribosome silencing factor [Bacteroidetes bacterium]|nr:ribosome silencing factor [Bacteroidota bacterium]MBS1640918.1 ribosome silencing factor [Bacteroidota bacterium]MBS1669949.1 ribosome silencing factor [Bacteroidota bacterium]